MSKEKLARRKAAGDDPTAMSKSNSSEAGMVPPQPIPGAPQGKGNMMNNPMVGQSMGGGMHQPGKIDQNNSQSPYGDPVFSPDVLMKTGAVGFTGNSGAPQNFVAGRGYNQQPYGTVDQPKGESQGMMEPMYLAKEAGERAEKLYAGGAAGDQTRMMPSYQVGPLGMMGTPIDQQLQGAFNPGQIPGTQSQQMFDMLGLQGMPDAQMAAGSNVQPSGTSKQVIGKDGKRKA